MNQEEIKKLLPHRDNMLLVEEAQVDGRDRRGALPRPRRRVVPQGHFPGNSVVPGVVLCEMMARATCVLLGEQLPGGPRPILPA